jgi:small subunit ribosomal protein S20
MPQHKSAAKRVRQNASRREQNRVHRSKMRTMIKSLRATEDPSAAKGMLSDIKAMLDRLATKGILHPNKAANYKSKLEKRVNSLEA